MRYTTTFIQPDIQKSIYRQNLTSKNTTQNARSYFSFGMQMPGRQSNPGEYDYGFNGMRKDAEVSGEGNSYTTMFRQYDPRLGRWKSIDPFMAMFPHQSPYVAFDNNPVYFIDPLGLAAEGGPDGGGGDKTGGGDKPLEGGFYPELNVVAKDPGGPAGSGPPQIDIQFKANDLLNAIGVGSAFETGAEVIEDGVNYFLSNYSSYVEDKKRQKKIADAQSKVTKALKRKFHDNNPMRVGGSGPIGFIFGNEQAKKVSSFEHQTLWGKSDGVNSGGKYAGEDGYNNGGKQLFFGTIGIVTAPFTIAAGVTGTGVTAIWNVAAGSFTLGNAIDDLGGVVVSSDEQNNYESLIESFVSPEFKDYVRDTKAAGQIVTFFGGGWQVWKIKPAPGGPGVKAEDVVTLIGFGSDGANFKSNWKEIND